MAPCILVTGGAGYIGSHTCVALLQAGYEVVVLDNLANSKRSVIDRVRAIAGRNLIFVAGDVRDRALLENVFTSHRVHAVIHFAGLKAVGESVTLPLAYYDNNVHGSLVLCQAMASHGVKNLVFSSSATVYGDPDSVPIKEDFVLRPANPYGRSKRMVEEMLRDLCVPDSQWCVALLRYFNPVGADESGMIGEDPKGMPNNLMPYLAQVAAGHLLKLSVFGSDYPTPDGTGVRDYIHVTDLAEGHLAALRYLDGHPGVLTANLGTGYGHSVLEMVRAFERVCGRTLPFEYAPRRGGDVAAYYADPSWAAECLGWSALRDIDAMCRDAWRWQQWAATRLN